LTGGRISRRRVLSSSLLGAATLAASATFAKTGIPWTAGTSPYPRGFGATRFFTQPERRCVDALVARLIPTDDLGPGAREAGVVDFIDDQLAGAYGRGESWYMKGPFAEGLKTQGYQSEHPPAGLYRAALAALDAHCRERFGDRAFSELEDDEQDTILKEIEDEKLEFEGVSASAFFEMLMENTIEGFFCDPLYGGNRDMVGWKLVGFPGARYDYRDHLDHNGAAIPIEPVSLSGRPAWSSD